MRDPLDQTLAALADEEQEARRERFAQAEQVTRFRSILDRGSEDQHEAVRRGYTSVEQLAIDELGRGMNDLLERVKHLEAHVVEEARLVDEKLQALADQIVERLHG